MATKPTIVVNNVNSQRSHRYADTFFDQHKDEKFPNGRPWNGNREMAANRGDKDGFVGPLSPGDHTDETFASVWHAPWMPEQRFFRFNYVRSKITIDYPAMLAHDQEYSDKYYAAAAVISYEKGWEPTQDGALPQFTIRKVIGDPPRSPKIAQAAMAGDRWLLGFSTEPNTMLQTLLHLSTGNLKEAYQAPLTPDEVLNASATNIKQMIAEAVAQALAARDVEEQAKKAKVAARMEKARAARKSNAASAEV